MAVKINRRITVDDEKEATEVKGDVSSTDTPAVDEKSSQFTKEQEEAVRKRVSDELAKRGDKAKTMEERLAAVESDNKRLRDAQLANAATKYGISVDKLREVGITDPDKVEAYARVFGKTGDTPKDDPIPDSGKTMGGGRTFTIEQIKDPYFFKANKEAILKAQEEGHIKE